jgi:DNA (cytosine-5)-methyltransferase 1
LNFNNVALHTGQLNGIAVCAGNGGLELGLKLALGERYKTVCYVEREAYNVRTLVARMEEQTLDCAPVWDDITTFDGKPWRGLVDIISAGFPCQPHSLSGKLKGITDERWIWDSINRVICEILPGIVWLENVPNLAFSGLDKVLGSLSEAGYNSIWDTFSAEETGASQKRERLFILSYRHGSSSKAGTKRLRRSARTNFNRRSEKSTMESTSGDRYQTGTIGENLRKLESSIFNVENGFGWRDEIERETRFAWGSSAIESGNFIFPPFRNDRDGWRSYLAEHPHFEPAVLRSSDGLTNRVDRLRSIGNGVVPLVAAYAFISLIRTAIELK